MWPLLLHIANVSSRSWPGEAPPFILTTDTQPLLYLIGWHFSSAMTERDIYGVSYLLDISLTIDNATFHFESQHGLFIQSRIVGSTFPLSMFVHLLSLSSPWPQVPILNEQETNGGRINSSVAMQQWAEDNGFRSDLFWLFRKSHLPVLPYATQIAHVAWSKLLVPISWSSMAASMPSWKVAFNTNIHTNVTQYNITASS